MPHFAAWACGDAAPLQELWAAAFDAWINPAGVLQADEVVYMCPADARASCGLAAGTPAWLTASLALAEREPHRDWGLFGMTAANPMGTDQSPEENCRQNRRLEQDLVDLCAASGGASSWWRSFGFAPSWHEQGFTVAAELAQIVLLARKFRQGAVYRYRRAPQAASESAFLLRSTVPVCLPETEADVLTAPCCRPVWDTADPRWSQL